MNKFSNAIKLQKKHHQRLLLAAFTLRPDKRDVRSLNETCLVSF